jgi:hypothetical protein
MPTTPRRLARTALAAFLVGFTFVAQTGSASAATTRRGPLATKKTVATHKKARTAGATTEQGIFGGCSLTVSLNACEQNLLQIRQAGMQVDVVSIVGATTTEISTFAAYAQNINMSIMWEINDPGFWGGAWIGANASADWSSFSSACGCTSTGQVLNYMIQSLAALPATYGYYAADDYTLTPGEVGGLRQYVNEIKAADPSHTVMVGSAQGQGTTYYASGATIGNEIYPETTQSLMPYSNNLATWQSVQQAVGQDQRAATRAGEDSAFILQAFSFGDNLDDGEAVGACTANMSQTRCSHLLQYPSASVQLELRNAVLEAAHPKLILWYTFDQASQGDRWSALSSVVKAPYPADAQAARAKHSKAPLKRHSTKSGAQHATKK